MKYLVFACHMTEKESTTWFASVQVIKNFLGNYKANNMLINLKDFGCNMNVKVYYLHCYLDHFPKNHGDLSEEQSETFYQDIKVMQECYQERRDVIMLGDCCWSLQRLFIY